MGQLDARLHRGELVDTVVAMEPDARQFVLGEHRRTASCSKLHLYHRVVQVIRAVKRPALVVKIDRFEAPQRFVLACEGSATASKAVETVAHGPLRVGMRVVVVMAGSDAHKARRQLDQAHGQLTNAGFQAHTAFVSGGSRYRPARIHPVPARRAGRDGGGLSPFATAQFFYEQHDDDVAAGE